MNSIRYFSVSVFMMMCFVGSISFAAEEMKGMKDMKGMDMGHSMKSESSPQGVQILEGEVLDMVCFMAHNGQGKKHKDCAQTCMNDGAPVGLLTTDGKLYLVIEDHNNKDPYLKIKKLAAEKVKVTGTVYIKAGIQSIQIKNVEKI